MAAKKQLPKKEIVKPEVKPENKLELIKDLPKEKEPEIKPESEIEKIERLIRDFIIPEAYKLKRGFNSNGLKILYSVVSGNGGEMLDIHSQDGTHYWQHIKNTNQLIRIR